VTIAAGFVCSDGVVLCADTLLSANYRQQGPKVWSWRGGRRVAVAVTGAGPYVLLKLAKEAIFRHLDATKGKGIPPGYIQHEIIERVIARIHDDHVDKATDWDRANGYGLSLLVAVRECSKATLYETDRRACSEVLAFACVGSGAPVGNYVASTTFSPTLSSAWAEISAAYVIQQSKAYGDDCGGDTNIIVVPNDGTALALSRARIRRLEQSGAAIHEAFGRVLIANADAFSGDDFFRSLEALRKGALKMSNRIAIESGKAGDPVEHTFIHVKRPLLRLTDREVQKTPKRGRKSRPPSQG
jgi:20S proteasome alpha/beta subunit